MSKHESDGDAAGTIGPIRHLMVDGAPWSVREATGVYDRRARVGLIFESDAAVRLVRNYPSNWAELPDEELYLISWNT